MWHRDLYPFFRAPQERSVPINMGTATLLVSANPDRVVLMIGCSQSGSLFLSTVRNPPQNTGFFVDITAQPFILTQALHGVLAQCEWWLTSNALLSAVSVCEIILDRKPTLVQTNG